MAKFQKTKKLQNFLYSKITLTLLAILIVFFGYTLVTMIGKSRETGINKEKSLRELQTLQNREAVLNSKINDLQTDEGKEAAIRDKFGSVKEGEGVVIIPEKDNDSTATEEKSWWERFLITIHVN